MLLTRCYFIPAHTRLVGRLCEVNGRRIAAELEAVEFYSLLSQGVFEHFDATNQVRVGRLKTFSFAQ
jgi:hypothetical protein